VELLESRFVTPPVPVDPASNGHLIRLDGVRKAFGAIKAVDGVSLDIARGEAFGLLGPNGAGKTTTISMIVGLLAPDAGTVAVGGADPTVPATRRRIGICPQSVSLYPELTGRQNLAFFGRLQGLAGRDLRARVDWALDFAGLTDRGDGVVGTYSGGMQRRLNLAAGLVHDPEILLCDEPTVGVDPQSRNHLYESIERLRDEGRTILYTTHYMEEAQRLCGRVAILDHGVVLAQGSPDELIAAHGGTAAVVAELSTPPPPGLEVPGPIDGQTLRFESTAPLQDVARLVERGLRFDALRIQQPDLESVFLALTGRRLRDD
jgi:ABC-2 type transport system ATP-binding protein